MKKYENERKWRKERTVNLNACDLIFFFCITALAYQVTYNLKL